ncbi:MAG: nitroreductase family protein [Anaerococcus sp.]
MDLDKVLETRVSSRKFLDEKLTNEEIEKLIDAAKKSPIGHGAYDSVHLTVIRDKTLIEEMSKEYNELKNNESDFLFGASTFIMFSYNRDSTVEYEDAGCVIQNMSLKAAEMGLGSCYIRGLVHTLGPNANYVKKLNLPEGFRPISGLVVGKVDYDLVGKNHSMEVTYIE